MRLGNRVAAKPKGEAANDDAPTQVPMKAEHKELRNPTTDQKKVRRQMSRQKTAAASDLTYDWVPDSDPNVFHLESHNLGAGGSGFGATVQKTPSGWTWDMQSHSYPSDNKSGSAGSKTEAQEAAEAAVKAMQQSHLGSRHK